MKQNKSICLECNSPLSKSKTNELLICKNKSCKKEYNSNEYESLLNNQKIEESLERELDKLVSNEQFITSTPSKYFNLGDIVNSTYGQSMTVVQKEMDKFYLLSDSKNQKRWVRWHEIYLSSTIKATVSFNKRSENINKRIQFSNRRLDGVLHYFYSCGLNMNPEYQRGFVWEEQHKTKLIDAIFNGNDIGKMIFIRLPYKVDSYSYEILDGKQRLSTIIEFIEDRFQYKGFYFSQLSERDRSEFLNFLVGVGETDEGFTDDDKIRYFLSVNDTGVPQDPKLIEELNKKLQKH